MSSPVDPSSPFARVPSLREKLVTLVSFVFMTSLSASLPLFVEISFKELHSWLALYGVTFFGLMSLHSWKSIRNKWSIQEDNDASGGLLAVLQSIWTLFAIAGLWLLARYVLP